MYSNRKADQWLPLARGTGSRFPINLYQELVGVIEMFYDLSMGVVHGVYICSSSLDCKSHLGPRTTRMKKKSSWIMTDTGTSIVALGALRTRFRLI